MLAEFKAKRSGIERGTYPDAYPGVKADGEVLAGRIDSGRRAQACGGDARARVQKQLGQKGGGVRGPVLRGGKREGAVQAGGRVGPLCVRASGPGEGARVRAVPVEKKNLTCGG